MAVAAFGPDLNPAIVFKAPQYLADFHSARLAGQAQDGQAAALYERLYGDEMQLFYEPSSETCFGLPYGIGSIRISNSPRLSARAEGNPLMPR